MIKQICYIFCLRKKFKIFESSNNLCIHLCWYTFVSYSDDRRESKLIFIVFWNFGLTLRILWENSLNQNPLNGNGGIKFITSICTCESLVPTLITRLMNFIILILGHSSTSQWITLHIVTDSRRHSKQMKCFQTPRFYCYFEVLLLVYIIFTRVEFIRQ